MRKLLLIPILFLFAGLAKAAPTFVQGGVAVAGASPRSVVLGANATSGDVLISCVRTANNTATYTWSDTQSNSYSDTGNGLVSVINATAYIQCKCAVASSTGALTMTVADNDATAMTLAVAEYSGIVGCTNDGFSATATASTGVGGGQNMTSGNLTTTANGDVIIGWCYDASGNTVTAGTGFASREAPAVYAVLEDQVKAAAGAIAATYHTTNNNSYGALAFALKASTSGGIGGAAGIGGKAGIGE